MPATDRTDLKSSQTVLGHEYDICTTLHNDVRMPGHTHSPLTARCSEDLNCHLLLPQRPISVSKHFILEQLLGTDSCQHSMISSTVTTLKRNLSSLTQLRERCEHEKKKWNDLPTRHYTVTVRTKNTTPDAARPGPLLLSWGLHRLTGDWESRCKAHENQRTTQR